jgi:dCTP deaminase
MTLLKHEDLWGAIKRPIATRLVVTPRFDDRQVGEASIDLRLGTEFLVLRRTLNAGLDPTEFSQADIDHMQERILVPYGQEIWLHPGHFMLAATLEYLRLPDDLGAYVLGRSSWGRVGLIVATAIMVQPGFKGCLTLELVNDGDSPIKLYPGARIAQIAVHTLDGPTKYPYGPKGKYEAPIAPQASRLAKEAEESKRFDRLSEALRARMLDGSKR